MCFNDFIGIYSFLTIVLGLDSQSDFLKACPMNCLYSEFTGLFLICFVTVLDDDEAKLDRHRLRFMSMIGLVEGTNPIYNKRRMVDRLVSNARHDRASCMEPFQLENFLKRGRACVAGMEGEEVISSMAVCSFLCYYFFRQGLQVSGRTRTFAKVCDAFVTWRRHSATGSPQTTTRRLWGSMMKSFSFMRCRVRHN